MARLKTELLERFETHADRVADVGEELDRQGRFRRVVEQVVACGTSVGANAFEADEALSSADFCKALGIVLRELAETRFWVRFIGRRGWIKEARLAGVVAECGELRAICGAMVARTRRRIAKK